MPFAFPTCSLVCILLQACVLITHHLGSGRRTSVENFRVRNTLIGDHNYPCAPADPASTGLASDTWSSHVPPYTRLKLKSQHHRARDVLSRINLCCMNSLQHSITEGTSQPSDTDSSRTAGVTHSDQNLHLARLSNSSSVAAPFQLNHTSICNTMETNQSHWAPQLRPNGDGAPSSVSQKFPLPTISFLGLPRELRDKIYTYLIPSHLCFTMQNQSREETYWWKGRLQTRHHPIDHYLAAAPVLLLNHQVRAELLSAIYAKTIFTFNWRRRASFILTCLQFIPEQAKGRIAHLSWTEWSLHTGGERRGYTGWAKVMRYVATTFSSLRTIYCSFPSGAHGCHHYHNWEVPRLAVSMLMEGRIEEVRWGWCSDGFSYRLGMRDGDVIEVAMKLLEIPHDEDKDGEMGFEYGRLLRGEGEFDGDDKVDRWAAECLKRSKHEVVVVTDFEERLLRIRRR